jgi:hypothetical protein
MIGVAGWLSLAKLSDEAILDNPRWHRWSAGAQFKYVRTELAWFWKCLTGRKKDLADIQQGARLSIAWDAAVVNALNRTNAKNAKRLSDCMKRLGVT